MNAGEHRCGYVAVVGRPNVGKSTLVNALVGETVSIVTHKPQTTRNRIHGILTQAGWQAVFIDTPGLHGGHDKPLNRVLNRTAAGALHDADLVLFLVAGSKWLDEDEAVLRRLDGLMDKVILVVNKTDLLSREQLLPALEELGKKANFKSIIPVSAMKSQNFDALREVIGRELPPGPAMYGEDQYTDQSLRFLASELIREKLMESVHEELPYATAVSVDSFKETAERIEINATIWVEKDSQKGIVIGKGGQRLKGIGSAARKALRKLTGERVHLELWVKVKKDWSEDETALRNLGFGDT